MAINYPRIALVAQRLIDQNGRSLTITLRGRTPSDPTKPWNGPADASSKTIVVTGVVVPDSQTDPKGDLVRQGKRVAYIAALDTDPALVEEYDMLHDGADTWKIVSVDILAPGPIRLLYTLHLTQ